MDVKEIISRFVQRNKELILYRVETKQVCVDGEEVLANYLEKLVNSEYNLALGPDLATYLQLANDQALVKTYDLEDVRALFKSLISTSTDNVDLYFEAANFEWAVMDNPGKALEFIENGQKRVLEKIKEFKELSELIKEEKR